MSEVLLVERSEGIATLTLNRPAVLNALSRELRAAITHAFQELKEDAETGVVILTGAGRAFCAGVDLKEIGGEGGATATASFSLEETGLVRALRSFDRPIIAAINGFAITGGFELALMCDVLIASTEARFADTHARVGIIPGWGLSQRLPRLIGISRAKELSFTGNYLGAERAEAWGLVNSVFAPDELLPACRALARDMLSCDPEVLRGIKALIDRGFEGTLKDGLEEESRASAEYGRKVSSESVAMRRKQVQERGRSQSRP